MVRKAINLNLHKAEVKTLLILRKITIFPASLTAKSAKTTAGLCSGTDTENELQILLNANFNI